MDSAQSDVTRPFLRWAGSKRQIIPILAEYWGSHFSRYLEPFVGSASLFFRLKPAKAILGDLNAHLMGTYCAVRDDPVAVARHLRRLAIGREAYGEIRVRFNKERDNIRRAAQFIYLNRFCFNGLYRTNLSGEFNVPYGADKSGSLPTLNELRAYALLLKKCYLHAGDFEGLLRKAVRGDFVYMDPPFAVSSRRVFREYDPNTFDETDVRRLRKQLSILHKHGVRFLVSYAESEEAEVLAEGFDVQRVYVRRNIAGFAGRRKKVAELLISN